ncbi:hypothetical protein BLNAU_6641 [Blattamonas nauphoetae]|uniref:Uncharacterized protein n=1 Tax=Blattamonas nauphoetae TaxID=2049346 RepID=A0ABQ9Y3R3_9EUKA|nr:hypothetical protein BLNAU_6641 [Blattamonas nauphoetae]
MPPKHLLGRNLHATQQPPQQKHISSSTSDNHIVDSTIPSSLENINESPLNSYPIPAPTELLTITPNDHQYIQISKQILQYEMKLKQINNETMPERPRLGAHEIGLPTSTMSDWRLVLQDSISQEALQEGGISLFNQIDTDLPLSENEMNHAVRFLEYATLHVKYRLSSDSRLLETILSKDVNRQTNLTSALLKLVCHPSDTLQMAALSFLDSSISKSYPPKSRFAMAVKRLLPQLLERLKPHEIPFTETTIKFHRHLISILDKIFSFSSPETVRHCLEIEATPPLAETLQSEKLDSIFKPSFVYLRSLMATPVCSPETHSGYILLSTMKHFREIVQDDLSRTSFPEVQHFFGEIRQELLEELASILGITSTNEAKLCLHSDWTDPKTVEQWLKGFDYLLGRVSEGTQFSDLGTVAVALFLSHRPSDLDLFFCSEEQFGLKMNDTIVSSSPLNAKSLWTLFTPTQPHHATILLDAFKQFMTRQNSVTVEKHIWSSWFPSFIKAIDPSKLSFTAVFITLHTQLIEILLDNLNMIDRNYFCRKCELTDQQRSELDETYRAFYTRTKDYVVHLSLHPFALDEKRSDVILDFLVEMSLRNFDNSLNKPYREEVRKAMDASALSSSSPPFILTSQLICRLTNDQMIDIVDRIVVLLDSDSSQSHPSSRIVQKSRKIKRTILTHIGADVDLEAVGIAKRIIDQNSLPIVSNSKELNNIILRLVIRNLPHIHRLYATRLCQSQFDHLLAPSIDILRHCLIHPSDYRSRKYVERKDIFVEICRLCDRRVIAEYLSRTGFFSLVVSGLLNYNFEASEDFFRMIVDRSEFPNLNIDDRNKIRRTVPRCLEEGWQDVMEYNIVQGNDVNDFNVQYRFRPMMQYLGANVNWLYG